MELLELFYIVLILTAIALTATLIWVGKELVNTLRAIRIVAEDIKDTTKDLQAMKEGLKLGALSVVSGLIAKLRGGDKHE